MHCCVCGGVVGWACRLGFEAPMFVPTRLDPDRLLSARNGECKGGVSRALSASAGAMVLVTGLAVAPYVFARLRHQAPNATATLDWRSPLPGAGHLLLFDAFVTNQKKTTDTRHVEDARLAVTAPMSCCRPVARR